LNPKKPGFLSTTGLGNGFGMPGTPGLSESSWRFGVSSSLAPAAISLSPGLMVAGSPPGGVVNGRLPLVESSTIVLLVGLTAGSAARTEGASADATRIATAMPVASRPTRLPDPAPLVDHGRPI
jgi:hypothetical protein